MNSMINDQCSIGTTYFENILWKKCKRVRSCSDDSNFINLLDSHMLFILKLLSTTDKMEGKTRFCTSVVYHSTL